MCLNLKKKIVISCIIVLKISNLNSKNLIMVFNTHKNINQATQINNQI